MYGIISSSMYDAINSKENLQIKIKRIRMLEVIFLCKFGVISKFLRIQCIRSRKAIPVSILRHRSLPAPRLAVPVRIRSPSDRSFLSSVRDPCSDGIVRPFVSYIFSFSLPRSLESLPITRNQIVFPAKKNNFAGAL